MSPQNPLRLPEHEATLLARQSEIARSAQMPWLAQALAARVGCVTAARVAGPFGPYVLLGFDQKVFGSCVLRLPSQYGVNNRQSSFRLVAIQFCTSEQEKLRQGT
jgi:hypothetical protein